MKRNGFSFVEMSLVLVTIGLIVLIGLKTSKAVNSAEVRKRILVYTKVAQAFTEYEAIYPNMRRYTASSARDTGDNDSWGAPFFRSDNESRVDIKRMLGIEFTGTDPDEYVTECYITPDDYFAVESNENSFLCVNSDHKAKFAYFYCNAENILDDKKHLEGVVRLKKSGTSAGAHLAIDFDQCDVYRQSQSTAHAEGDFAYLIR